MITKRAMHRIWSYGLVIVFLVTTSGLGTSKEDPWVLLLQLVFGSAD
jgi:hypothetical protein